MGVELRQDLDMNDDGGYSDYDLALHVKDVLLSVSSVSLLPKPLVLSSPSDSILGFDSGIFFFFISGSGRCCVC